MELRGPVTRIEVMEINTNSVVIKLQTSDGEEYLQEFIKGDVVQISMYSEQEEGSCSCLESYLSGPMPPELLHNLEEKDDPTAPSPPRRNRLLEELMNLAPHLKDTCCSECGKPSQLLITHEGIVLGCRACGQTQRVDADLLQRLIDTVGILCFSCAVGKLKSEATAYANILQCRNPDCGSRNSWRGISDRIES